jgi:transcriptional regulator with XRE-family HTH domain
MFILVLNFYLIRLYNMMDLTKMDDCSKDALKAAIGERFKRFREHVGISQKALAQELNILQSTVSQLESGLVYPGFVSLAHLVTQRKLNPAWLITGEEEMLLHQDQVVSRLKRKRAYSDRYVELLEMMEDPDVEQIIFAKMLELKRFAPGGESRGLS